MTEESTSQGNTFDSEMQLDETRQYWDHAAVSFDQEPDHGLQLPGVRKAWTGLLSTWLPAGAATILDVGCGTGSLSLVMAGLGHHVTGIDLSPAMIARAQAKAIAHTQSIEFHIMDATAPQFPPQSFDAIVCRHVLWTLPEPAQVLRRWVRLFKPNGRFVLIEGYWDPGGGLHAAEIMAALPSLVTTIAVQDLGAQPDFWGKIVTDERFAIIADLCL